MDMQKRAEEFTRLVDLELKGRIIAQGFTAQSVAEKMGRSVAAFNRWINGKAAIPMSVLCEASEVIDVDPQVIVETAYSRLCVAHGERNGFTYPKEAREAALAEGELDATVTSVDFTQSKADEVPEGLMAARRGKSALPDTSHVGEESQDLGDFED